MNARERVGEAWHDLVRRYGCDATLAQNTLDHLLRAYAEPHRHYHTLTHIADLLQLLDEHGGASDKDALTLSILFHDVVYDTARQDNEMASAKLAVNLLTPLGFPGECVAKVERCILATQHNASAPSNADAALHLLLDLDLSVLAWPPDRYRTYAQSIRQEYLAVPEDLYRPGRRRVLEGFLARPQIYRTERLRALWEASARANLAREIAELT
jgi:predicted metal-dependent HD superfamily phosphohydrolase